MINIMPSRLNIKLGLESTGRIIYPVIVVVTYGIVYAAVIDLFFSSRRCWTKKQRCLW